MAVVLRTHGGLGNQLFQLLFARLYCEQRGETLFEVHDIRYPHAFGRSAELVLSPAPRRTWMRLVSSLRIPKLASRMGIGGDGFRLFGTSFLDGYFQRMEDYSGFDNATLGRHLVRLRDELGAPSTPIYGEGMHLRLGDFFRSEAEVTAHLKERLGRMGQGVGIVTNDEHRLADPSVAAILKAADARLIKTGDMSAEEVLRTLASFRRVDGNDSTLLFWASVLSDMDCAFDNAELRNLRARYRHALSM